MHKLAILVVAAIAVMAGPGKAEAALVTYQFSATNDLPFALFENGDTVSGSFTYDDADTSGASGNIWSLQNAPSASLVITFTDASTGATATASVDPANNAVDDLTVRGQVTFIYTNLLTGTNTVFGSGLEFVDVLLRFSGPSSSLSDDLTTLTPTYVTMTLAVNGRDYGPNFAFTQLQRVEVAEPASIALLGTGLLGLVWARRRRAA